MAFARSWAGCGGDPGRRPARSAGRLSLAGSGGCETAGRCKCSVRSESGGCHATVQRCLPHLERGRDRSSGQGDRPRPSGSTRTRWGFSVVPRRRDGRPVGEAGDDVQLGLVCKPDHAPREAGVVLLRRQRSRRPFGRKLVARDGGGGRCVRDRRGGAGSGIEPSSSARPRNGYCFCFSQAGGGAARVKWFAEVVGPRAGGEPSAVGSPATPSRESDRRPSSRRTWQADAAAMIEGWPAVGAPRRSRRGGSPRPAWGRSRGAWYIQRARPRNGGPFPEVSGRGPTGPGPGFLNTVRSQHPPAGPHRPRRCPCNPPANGRRSAATAPGVSSGVNTAGRDPVDELGRAGRSGRWAIRVPPPAGTPATRPASSATGHAPSAVPLGRPRSRARQTGCQPRPHHCRQQPHTRTTVASARNTPTSPKPWLFAECFRGGNGPSVPGAVRCPCPFKPIRVRLGANAASGSHHQSIRSRNGQAEDKSDEVSVRSRESPPGGRIDRSARRPFSQTWLCAGVNRSRRDRASQVFGRGRRLLFAMGC